MRDAESPTPEPGSDIAWVLALTVGQVLTAAVSFLILANLLGPADFGVFAVGTAAGAFVPLLVGFGTEHTLLMYGSRRPDELPTLLGGSFLVWTSGAVVLAALVAAGLHFVPQGARVELVFTVLLASGFVGGVASPLLTNYCRAVGRVRVPWAALLAGKLAFLGFLIVPLPVAKSLVTASVALLCSQAAVVLFITLYAAPWMEWKADLSAVVRHRKMAMKYWLAQIADLGFLRADVFVVGALLGAAQVGAYAAGAKIITLTAVVPSAFHVVLMPDFHRRGRDQAALEALWRKASQALGVLGTLVVVYLALHGPYVAQVLFGREYEATGPVISVLALYAGLNFLGYPLAMVADARGAVGGRLRARLAALPVLGLGLAAGTLAFGVAGAAAGAVLAMAVYVAVLNRVAWPESAGVWRDLPGAAGVPLLICAAGGAVSLAVTRSLGGHTLGLVVGAASYLLLVGVVLWLVFGATWMLKTFVRVGS